jgi:hypothetical protein
MHPRRCFLTGWAGLLAQPLTQPGAPEDPWGLVWREDTIAWTPDDPPGSKYAVLDGDRTRPDGLFTYAFWLPGGVWAPPHVHSQTAHVAVLRGVLRLGFGGVSDRAAAREIRAGEFFIVRADQPHFEGSDGPCLIVGTARGGWTTTVLG